MCGTGGENLLEGTGTYKRRKRECKEKPLYVEQNLYPGDFEKLSIFQASYVPSVIGQSTFKSCFRFREGLLWGSGVLLFKKTLRKKVYKGLRKRSCHSWDPALYTNLTGIGTLMLLTICRIQNKYPSGPAYSSPCQRPQCLKMPLFHVTNTEMPLERQQL